MTLDTLLTKLSVSENGTRKPNPNYQSILLPKVTEELNKLEACDIKTTEGQTAYSTITGENPSQLSQNELTFRQKTRVVGGRSDLTLYIDKHFNKVVNDIEQKERTILAFQYCPEKDTQDKPYNEAKKIVLSTREELKQIQEDPEKYIEEQLQKETPLMAYYISRFKNEFIEIKQRNTQINGMRALFNYGVEKFLEKTKHNLDTQAKRVEEAQDAIDIKIRMAEINMERELTIEEITNLTSEKRATLKTALEECPDAHLLIPFRQNTLNYAIQTLDEKDKAHEEALPMAA